MSEAEAKTEIADELVESTKAVITDLTTVVPELAEFRSGMLQMFQAAYRVQFDLTTTKGDEAARKLRKQLVTSRTSLERRRIEKNQEDRATIQARIETRDAAVAKLVEIVRSLEEPVDRQIRADEERRRLAKEEADRIERERIVALRQRVDDIQSVAVRAVGLPSSEIEQKIALVGRIEVDTSFEEFEASAHAAKASTLTRLNELLTDARQREAERAEAERNKAEVERLRREAEERRQADEAREREAAAARAREAAEQRQREEAARREREQAEQKRQAQSAAAQAAVGEIQRIARSALTATSTGLAAMIEKIAAVRATIDCGDYAGLIDAEREATTEHLREMIAQKEQQERQAAEAAEALRVSREREQRQQALADEIEVIRRQLFICQEQEHTIDQVEVRIEEMRALPLDPDHFGVLFHSAVAVRDATVLGLQQLLEQMRNPPEPLVKVQATPAAPATGDEEIEVVPMPRCAPPAAAAAVDVAGESPATEHWPAQANVEQLLGLMNEVVNVVKSTKRARKDGPYTVPAADFQSMCEALTRVRLPAGAYYAGDGTLMNSDGSRSVFDDVEV